MKKTRILNAIISSTIFFFACFFATSCTDVSAIASSTKREDTSKVNSVFSRKATAASKAYWYDGTAELTSFKLEQARYGEIHEGTAVLVYVTEPFSVKNNAKADSHEASNIPVLKLNNTLKFNTGIYPYSMMNSTFFPFEDGDASLKISSSTQEWCGMTYVEMKNSNKLVFDKHSYFEGASFKNKSINKTILEDDLWSLIRLNPEMLPTGKQIVIPSMFYLSLNHRPLQGYETKISLERGEKGISTYSIRYPQLDRTFSISFSTDFPYEIVGWEDSHQSGFGINKKHLTTKATRLKSIKTDYWNKNGTKHASLRASLSLD